MKKSELRQVIKEELQKLNETWKADLLNDYFSGNISADELDKKAKEAGTEIASKKELNTFLKNKFMQDMMADTHNISASDLIKKVKKLLPLAEDKNKLSEAIKPQFKKGQKVKMADIALDNYGKKYKNKVFTISHVATSSDDHPGFDNIGQALYDLKELDFSLYDYELEPA